MPKGKHRFMEESIVYAMYYAMGKDRSLDILSEKTGISKRALSSWSVKYKWQDRMTKQNEEIAKELEKKTHEGLVQIKSRHAQIAKTVISQYLTSLQKMMKAGTDLEFDTAGLEKMLRHELLVTGGLVDQNPPFSPINLVNVNLPPAAQEFRTLMAMLPPDAQIAVTTAIRKMKELKQSDTIKIPIKEVINADVTNTTPEF